MPAKSIKSTHSLRSSTKVHPQPSLRSSLTTNGSELQQDQRAKSTSSAKNDAYKEALQRSLMESQIERDFLNGAALSRYNTGAEDHALFSEGTLSERMLTITTTGGLSFGTPATGEGDIEDITAEDFPEFRIETAADKMKVNLTDDLIVSLTTREEDSKLGINAAWQSINEIRTDIFESRIAEKCVWFDLSGNSLQFDSYAREENVLGTVKSRQSSPCHVPDIWSSFQSLEDLTFGQSCSEESTCKRGNLLRNIPFSIFSLTTLRVLSFSSNHLQEVPREVANLVNLEKLSLDDNELLEFQPALLDLPKLRFLDLDNNSLEHVELNTLPRYLRCLRLKGNNISHISLLPCKNSLQQLDLSCNNLKNIDNISFKCLVKLKFFDLSSNVIEEIPSLIGKLENLRKLYLDDNMLEMLTPSICLLQKLNVLNLSENSLTDLPPDIGPGLFEGTHVENNELETLPVELERVPRLLTLCLSGNKLVAVPPVIARLPYLRDLLLFNNKIRKLDMSLLAPCHNLVVLGLAMNRIKVIPAAISQLESIRILQLDGNRLTAIPDEMSEVTTLKYLSLSNNRIEYIPDTLSSLSNLVGLLMDGNSLTEVPTSIGQLQNLRVLSVKHNYIETIPESISLLVNIELVDVCDNKLTRLPTTISEFSERVELKTNNNQLTLPPQQVADKGIISIKAFLDGYEDSVEVESIHSEFETTAI
ncbi:LOW QUALITY PROTEIN: leucine-rich repeat and IQ domain-containing protein 4-like [Bolinopsis microptera]|uniref:LOW QUALITY PROTEIN: leucine-rich repeat and IQ domain-containing protein 4-like n=1 Tax=Bolinopsis microptera TaxID=2820187 RepID=UPI00307A258A